MWMGLRTREPGPGSVIRIASSGTATVGLGAGVSVGAVVAMGGSAVALVGGDPVRLHARELARMSRPGNSLVFMGCVLRLKTTP
jgi:hypothetical protein